MLNKTKLITNQLLNMSEESRKIKDESDLRDLMDKYDMLFVGEHFNKIYSAELVHSLKLRKVLNISHEELLSLIPDICKNLKMKYEPLYLLKDTRTLADYSIELF